MSYLDPGWCSEASRAACLKASEAARAKRQQYTVNGETGTLFYLSKLMARVSYVNVIKRLRKGWSVEDALLKPPQAKRNIKPKKSHPWRKPKETA